jgi:hypothetical protein
VTLDDLVAKCQDDATATHAWWYKEQDKIRAPVTVIERSPFGVHLWRRQIWSRVWIWSLNKQEQRGEELALVTEHEQTTARRRRRRCVQEQESAGVLAAVETSSAVLSWFGWLAVSVAFLSYQFSTTVYQPFVSQHLQPNKLLVYARWQAGQQGNNGTSSRRGGMGRQQLLTPVRAGGSRAVS